MEIFQGLIQPPKIQSADETIPTLCDRVESATKISDRRSAVLGLKSFSRDYRETVIASGLKPLLNTLKRDFEDDSSVKAILETLLILFIRGDGSDDLTRNWISQQSRLQNGKYPSPLVMKQEREQVDQFSLWIADAITQSDEIVHLVIELLNTGNFHIRLYTTQLLEAIVATRPERSRSAITSLPTGISTLVSLLGDVHEPVRDEAILLLMAVVNDSPHVQKLVAFENIFERLFAIIEEEGGLRGSLVVNDCLSLINNILKYNTSNQSLFLETGNLPKLAQILNEPLADDEFFWNDQRVININTALDILSLTVEPGNSTTEKHQNSLTQSNVLMIVLRLAFYEKIPQTVRPTALLTAAGLIRGNEYCQKEFSKIDVPYFNPSSPMTSNVEQVQLVPVVSLLIHWVLYANTIQAFPTRMASMELIKAYLEKSEDIQLKFLSYQIEKYHERNNNRENDPLAGSNIFESLLEYDPDLKLNPYKLFFTADIFMFLFKADNEASDKVREISRSVRSGVSIDDEDALTSVKMLSELLITSLTAEDIRIPIAFVTLLIFWLFGDINAVNDFLSEKSAIQSLLSFSYQLQDDDITIKCLVTMLLGVSYEFSSKNSPFPRKDYFEYITKTLGRDNYLSRINQFRSDSLFTKFKEFSNFSNLEFDETGLPQVYFSPIFVQFFTENNYRIRMALLHNPDEEPCSQITFEAFESLQNDCSALKTKLRSLEEANVQQLDELKSKLDISTKEYEKYYKENKLLIEKKSTLDESHQVLKKELGQASQTVAALTKEIQALVAAREEDKKGIELKELQLRKALEKLAILEKELKDTKFDKEKAEEGINKMSRELFSLTRESQKLQEDQKTVAKEKQKNLELLEEKRQELESSKNQLEALRLEKQDVLKELQEWKSKYQSNDALLSKVTEKLRSLADSSKSIQNERDDLARKIETIEIEHGKRMTELKAQVDSLSREKGKLISEIELLRKNVEESERMLETERGASFQKTNELEKTIFVIRNEVKTLEAQNNQFTTRNKELESKIDAHQVTQAESTSALQKVKNALEVSENKLKDALEENKTLQQSLQSQEDKLNQALAKLDMAEKSRALDLEKLKSLQDESDRNKEAYGRDTEKLKDDIKKLENRTTGLSSTVTSLENEIKQKEQKVTELDEKIISLTKEKANFENQLVQVTSEKRDLTNELKSAQDSKENLINELRKLKDTIKEKDQNIQEFQQSNINNLSTLSKVQKDSEEIEKKLKAQIEDLQSKHNQKVKEFEKERKLFNDGSDLVTQEYSKKISILEEQVNKYEIQIEETKMKLQETDKKFKKVNSELQKSQDNNDRAVKALESAVKKAEEETEDTMKKYNELKVSSEKESSSFKKELESLTNNVTAKKKENDQAEEKIKSLEDEVRRSSGTIREMETLKEEKDKLLLKVNSVEKERNEKVENLEVKVKSLTKSKEDLTKQLEVQAELAKNNKSLVEEKNSLERRLISVEAQNKDAEENLVKWKDKFSQHEEQLNSSSSDNDKFKDELKVKEGEITRLNELLRDKDQDSDKTRDQTLNLQNRIAELKEENKRLRTKAENSSEVDDLMLLVSDLDEKNAKYRALLKSNAIEFSSDEDEDDDDDDDNDDDDDDKEEDEADE